MYSSVFKKKIISIKVFTIVFLFSMLFLVTTAHAAVPYTYTPSATKNTIDITFDDSITVSDKTKITVYQTTASGGLIEKTPSTVLRPLKISAITPIASPSKVLNITIGDLDPSVTSYAIKIEKDALTFSNNYIPLTDFILPFSSTDFASGFNSIFMDNSVENLNKNIFAYNSTRDISIYVPKKYITSIETIHKKGELTTTSYPRLTNIDVKTDALVKRLKVSITKLGATDTTPAIMLEKELFPSTSSAVFTTGVAGLDIDTTGQDYTINIKAFDANGRLLEDSKFDKKLVDVKTELVSTYVPKTSSSSNKTITLYDLMKNPATLTSVLTAYTTDLNSIKVMYPNDEVTRIVSNSEGQTNDAANVLAKVLSEGKFQYIKFASALKITPSQIVKFARTYINGNIILDGNGSTINGNVTVGDGDSDNNIYELRNITINGDLTINVSSSGDCILTNNVKVTGKTIVNGKKTSEVLGVVSMEDKTSYKIGDTVKIGVKFNEPVFVAGSPTLTLTNSGTTVIAVYDSVSTEAIAKKDIAVFKYVVEKGASDFKLQTDISNPISLSSGIIQPRDGSNVAIPIGEFSGVANKLIYTSTTNKNIIVDPSIPEMPKGDIKVVASTNPQVITCVANDILDEVSAEIAANWKIKDTITDKVYTPKAVSLNGDKKTVTIVMPDGVILISGSIEAITEGVKDKSGNVVDLTSPTGALTFTKGTAAITTVKQGDAVTITATFSEALADSPVVNIEGVDADIFVPAPMTKVDATHYKYNWTVGLGNGGQTFKFSLGTDIAGNVITAKPTIIPTAGTITIDNTAPTFSSGFTVDNSVQPNTVTVVASEALDATKVTGNWKVENKDGKPYDVASAALKADKKTVVLTLKPVNPASTSTFITTVDAKEIIITPPANITDVIGNSYAPGVVTGTGTLTPDVKAPEVSKTVENGTATVITVDFSEVMNKTAVEDKANWTWTHSAGAITISSVALDTSGKIATVTLSGAALDKDTLLAKPEVVDVAGNAINTSKDLSSRGAGVVGTWTID
ncbi:hypothetical protein [Clostridium estertheticum]|uniref:hypothetical protein n=1 Tax=Clostridium estertheticum TaxID=238834 RepID=UPI001CF3AA38|nr:hypothetical protein [Clostridium estertheticum]MCB2339564.1 hypothetical protein [Clostridium estertheticum]